MIGLRQDTLIKQQCKKKRQCNPISISSFIQGAVDCDGHDKREAGAANKQGDCDADNSIAAIDTGAFTKEKSSDATLPKRNESDTNCATALSNRGQAERGRQRHQLSQKSTKIIINNVEGNSWKSLLRDVIMAFIPVFVLYKISMSPTISNVGYKDPNAPPPYSQEDMLQQLLFSLSLKKQQEELQKEHLFLEAMNGRKCYDFPTIDISTKMKMKQQTKEPRRKLKGKKKQRKQTNNGNKGKVKIGKMNRPLARRPPASPSSPPLVSSIASAFWGDDPPTAARVSKGSESTKGNDSMGNNPGGKKRAKKKKFGSR